MDCFSSRLMAPHHFLLRHLAAQAAERALHLAQITDFLAESHIAICDHAIAFCNRSQGKALKTPFKSLI